MDQIALCHQALNKFYAARSATNAIVPTSTRSFLRANFLFLSCDQITYSHSLYECVFSLHLLPFPSQVYFSLHLMCVNTHVRCACIATCTKQLAIHFSRNKTRLVFVSLNAPYSLEHFMYENKCLRRRLLILCLIVWCTLWSEKYGSHYRNAINHFFGRN